MEKELIRKKTAEIRNRMTELEVREKSEQIISRLEEYTFFKTSKNILLYYSYQNEVSTLELLEKYLLKKNIFLPKFISEDLFEPAPIKNLKELSKGLHGIAVPSAEVNSNVKLDLILIPGVVFDLKGQRIGRGKGHYDRFLVHQKDVLKVGLAYEFQIFDELPKDPYDVSVDHIITEKKIIYCN